MEDVEEIKKELFTIRLKLAESNAIQAELDESKIDDSDNEEAKDYSNAAGQEETKTGSNKQGTKAKPGQAGLRGFTGYLPPIDVQNWYFTYGSPPGSGVKAKTEFIADLRKAFVKGYDRSDLTIHIPQVFDQLLGSDTNFEQHASSTLQTLELHYRGNIVTQARAVIFLTPEMTRAGLDPLVYDNAEAQAEKFIEFFNILEFDEIELHRN